jgi:hypothetical protein
MTIINKIMTKIIKKKLKNRQDFVWNIKKIQY